MLALSEKMNRDYLTNSPSYPSSVPKVSRRSSMYQFFIENSIINRLIYNYRSFHFIFSSLSLVCFITRTVQSVFELIRKFSESEQVISTLLVITSSECWIFYIVLECIFFPSTSFVRNFDSIWCQIKLSSDNEANEQLVKSTRAANLQAFIVWISDIFGIVAQVYAEYLMGIDDLFFFIAAKLVDFYVSFLAYNILRGFFIAHSFIKVGHQHINHQITAIIKVSYVPDSTLYRLRHEHFELICCGNLCDKAYRRFVTSICSVMVPNAIVIIYNIAFIDISLSTRIIYIIILFKVFTILIFFFPCLIGFYSHPSHVREDIYQSTLIERSDSYKSEALLFLDLINKNSSGIRFMGLFLITPDIVPTLVTLIFTYVMAIPNFLSTN